MSDIIKLLPESVANQIAAGEVIQRPASVVKELIENAIDAKADKITLIIKDAGRLLIQVIDDGSGMSETDARKSFERHATSKIDKAEDLFQIHTFGFRGEALASIAAIAQVELKTKRKEDELGTKIIIEGSKFISQEECTCDQGTIVSVKNLFFNIPVRRNFLKSNAQELKLIIEEFYKVALVYPNLKFAFYNNDTITFDLFAETFKQRIVNMINKSYNEKLIPIEEQTEIVKVSGFVSKPEFAKKTRGNDQYFFVNNRFIYHKYLKHAVESSYHELIPDDMFPMFFIKLFVSPDIIDVNIHPTKTEINFQGDYARLIYAVIKSAIRKSFGSFSIQVPTLNFESDVNMLDFNFSNRPIVPPTVKLNPNYDPFSGLTSKKDNQDWNSMYQAIEEKFNNSNLLNLTEEVVNEEKFSETFIQYENKFIIGIYGKNIIIIDQQRAHQRILYEECLNKLQKEVIIPQIDMLPETINLNFEDSIILDESKDIFASMGFLFEKLGKTNYVIKTHPDNIDIGDIKDFFEMALHTIKTESDNSINKQHKAIAKTMAIKTSVKTGTSLNNQEMKSIANKLMKCKISDVDLQSKPTYGIFNMNTIANYL